jgi:hypothetical protein
MLLMNAHASNMVLDHRLNNLSIENRSNNSQHDAFAPPQQPLRIDASYYHFSTSNYMPLDAHDARATADIPPGVRLMSMPHYVVYYVMEFMVRLSLSPIVLKIR